MTIHKFLHLNIVHIAIIVVAATVFNFVGNRFITKIMHRIVRGHKYESKIDEKKREDTLTNVFQGVLVFMTVLISFLLILDTVHVNVAALLTGAGLFGIVFGFGAQTTVKNLLAGVFILTENQYRVGDVISLGGGTLGGANPMGVVEEITLRVTKIRDLDGKLITVPNGDGSVVTNLTFKYASVVIDITVDYKSNIDTVEKTVNAVGMNMPKDEQWSKVITEPIRFMRVENFTEHGVSIKLIGKVRPGAQWEVAGEFRRRVKTAFDTAGIKLTV